MGRRTLVAGNWKMHGTAADLDDIRAIATAARRFEGKVEVALCVPATLIHRAAEAVPGFAIGAQDVHMQDKGAHTGDTSAAMLRDAGAELTIVGHSERRDAHREDDAAVRAKAVAALAAGLGVILCVGESLAAREAGRAVATVVGQVGGSLPAAVDPARFAIAYEPIWAIGTGKVASCDDIAQMHAAIRSALGEALGAAGAAVPILYGGSVKAENAEDLFALAEVDGALVGGASLKAAEFVPIVAAAAVAVESRAAPR